MSRKAIFGIIFLTLLSLDIFVMRKEACHAQKRFSIKFATIAPEGSTWVKHMRRLDTRLNKKSNGMIRFRIYAGGIAGDEFDVLKKIRIGQIHCAAFSGVGIARIVPMVRVLDLPFLFRNRKEIDSVHEELKDFFSEHFRKAGFEFLAWAEVGNVHLFSKKPIRKRADLSGLKIWTWTGDPISKKTFTALGTSPIPLSITDVTTALSTNMIDTVYSPPLGALALQWHSHIKYMTSFPITHATGAVLISRGYFNKISSELTKLLKDEIQLAMNDLTSELVSQTKEAVSLIKKSGVVISPTPAKSDLRDFYMVHDQVAQDLAGVIYPRELLDRVYGILERIRRTK
ncbi:TRAP transporter substrate-binding protein DctP [Thermodesulfobacteriota bacterium]